jgi:hypothetical protein
MLQLHKLYIELTRRCNLKCAHCINGAARDALISEECLNKTFNVFDNIDWLVFGGGEPLLNIESLAMAVHHIIFQRIKVNRIFISTNGCCQNIDSDATIDLLSRIKYLCCNEFKLQLSNTQFHRESREERETQIYLSFKEKLNTHGISFIEYNETKDNDLIPEGRAEENELVSEWMLGQVLANFFNLLRIDDFIVKFLPHTPLYITCEGELLVNCHAYNNRSQFFIAHINELQASADPQALLLNRLERMHLLRYKTYDEYQHEKEMEELLEIWYH